MVLNLAKVPLFPTDRSRKTIVVVLHLRLSLWSDDKESICEKNTYNRKTENEVEHWVQWPHF